MYEDEAGESVTYATTREAKDAAVKPSAPVDDMISWIDRTQDEMALTLERLERAIGPILGEERPYESDDAALARMGSSTIVNRLASLGMRGGELNSRLGRLIARVEV